MLVQLATDVSRARGTHASLGLAGHDARLRQKGVTPTDAAQAWCEGVGHRCGPRV